MLPFKSINLKGSIYYLKKQMINSIKRGYLDLILHFLQKSQLVFTSKSRISSSFNANTNYKFNDLNGQYVTIHNGYLNEGFVLL